MKTKIVISVIALSLLVLSGCGGGGGPNEPDAPNSGTTPKVDDSLSKNYDVTLCDSSNKDAKECADAKEFDLDKERVAILNPSKDIGASEWAYFDGKRFAVVPKDETKISPMEVMAFGIWIHAQRAGVNWCGPCRMVAPKNYSEALDILKRYNLTGTKEQNEAILWMINKNLEKFASKGLPLKKAYEADIKALAESLVNLTVKGESPDLSHLHLVKDAKGKVLGVSSTPDSECNDEFGGCLDAWSNLSGVKVEDIAYKVNKESKSLKDYQKAFETLTCEDNEDKQIYMFGVEDNFANSNPEPTNPQGALLTVTSGWNTVSPYDNHTHMPTTADPLNNPMWFAETLNNLPTNMTKARMAIGYKYVGKGDTSNIPFVISDIANSSGGQYIITSWNHIANSNTYYKDLDQLNFTTPATNTLAYIQAGHNHLDLFSGGWFDVDYVAVAACVPKANDPEGIPVDDVPVKLSCNARKGEQLITVWGGSGDDFVAPTDAITPPPNTPSGTLKYDEPVKKEKAFVDRIALPSNKIYTQMQILVNTKGTANGFQNDMLAVGDVTSSLAYAQPLYTNPPYPTVQTNNGGTAHIISGTQTLNNSPMNLLNLANNNNYLDVLVMNHSEVDSVRISACAIDKKEGDIAIEKKVVSAYELNGVNFANFQISFTGSLPANQTFTISETIPSGAILSALNAPYPWSCSATPPVSGAVSITCSITSPAYLNQIPAIDLTMKFKDEKVKNCAAILTKNVFFNTDASNDESCDTAVIDNDDNDTGVCSEVQTLNLEPASSWKDTSTGSNPTVNNPIPNVWDSSYTWFEFPQNPWYGYYHLETDNFCACGNEGKVEINGMRIDNVGSISLQDLTTNTNTIITAQNTATTQNFMAQYPPASGSLTIPAFNSGHDMKLKFDIHNHKLWTGGAVKGKLTFTGHWGKCTTDDSIDGFTWQVVDGGTLSANPDVLVGIGSLGSGNNFDDNSTIAVIDIGKVVDTSGIPHVVDPIPMVVKGKDLIKTNLNPKELFGEDAPDNFDVIVGCEDAKIAVALNQAAPIVYHTNKDCLGNWLSYK